MTTAQATPNQVKNLFEIEAGILKPGRQTIANLRSRGLMFDWDGTHYSITAAGREAMRGFALEPRKVRSRRSGLIETRYDLVRIDGE